MPLYAFDPRFRCDTLPANQNPSYAHLRRNNGLLVYCSGATTIWIRPPLLSIRPPVLAVFDAGLVADAGGVKRASRRGYQSEQERSCDPLSGDRGEGVFHTT